MNEMMARRHQIIKSSNHACNRKMMIERENWVQIPYYETQASPFPEEVAFRWNELAEVCFRVLQHVSYSFPLHKSSASLTTSNLV
jgi:hypothetical protein